MGSNHSSGTTQKRCLSEWVFLFVDIADWAVVHASIEFRVVNCQELHPDHNQDIPVTRQSLEFAEVAPHGSNHSSGTTQKRYLALPP